jgi:hypothetical protein
MLAALKWRQSARSLSQAALVWKESASELERASAAALAHLF